MHAEWIKLRTLSGTIWLLAATIVLTVAVSTAATAATRCPSGIACPVDITKLSLTGVEFGQAVVAILGVLTIGSEYSTGMIRTTLTAMRDSACSPPGPPRRCWLAGLLLRMRDA